MSGPIPTSGVSLKPIEVSQALQDGDKFIKWDEESAAGVPVTLRVDSKGFFLFWTDQNLEVELLDLAIVRDVRTGAYAKLPKEPKLRSMVTLGSQGSLEEKTVTVCHGMDFVNVSFVNFCGSKKETTQAWTDELFSLACNVNQRTGSALRALEKMHTKLLLRAKHGVPIKSVIRMFAAAKEDKRRVEKALLAAGLPAGKTDSIPRDQFDFETFFRLYRELTQRAEIVELYAQLCGGADAISETLLVEFLNEKQRDPRLNEILHPHADAARAADLVRAYRRENDTPKFLSEDAFLRFLMSEDNPAVSQRVLDVCDLDQPLCHYFINSSHNTYLTGHQLTGKSSVEIYRQALLAGCRCVELDLWNGRTGEPVIFHGYTFVQEVNARDVLEAIAESAFKTSDCPVVLSFENHCNPRQQAKIANYCREIFGEMLLDRPLDSHPLDPGKELPSPWALRRKIIIKNKKKHHHHKPEPVPESESDAPVEARVEAEVEAEAGAGEAESGSSESDSSSGEEEEEEAAASVGDERGETHAAAEISALVNYVQPVHFTSFENAEKKNRFYEMSSFDEKQATTLLKERPIDFVNYNKKQLSRVYPAGTRFDSSNFMPQVFWNAGCQLVALNFQTLDLAMQLNLGAFEYSRRSGYLLKPEFMRRLDRRLDPFAESTVDGIIAGSLTVSVLSGQLLSERRVSSYVEVELFGLPADTVRKRFRTRTVPANGINPVYGDEPFVFKKVVLPELALLRVAAHEDGGGRLIGHRILPIAGLCPGYRHVPLRTEAGLPLAATLLLHVKVSDYVPDKLSDLAEALANPIKYQSELDKRDQQLRVLTDGTDVPVESAAAAAVRAASSPQPPPPVPVVPVTPVVPVVPAAPSTDAPPPDAAETTLAELQQTRGARAARQQLARKLDALRRKYAAAQPTTKFYVPGGLVKRLSSLNITSNSNAVETSSNSDVAPEQALAEAERVLRVRYAHETHAAVEKALTGLQQAELRALQDMLLTERKGLMTRLEAARRTQVQALCRDATKDERDRLKREIHKQSVARGLAERTRLEDDFGRRREALARQHERVRELLARKHRADLDALAPRPTNSQ